MAGRKPQQPLPMSYVDWVKLGRPPMSASIGQLVDWVPNGPLTKQRLNVLIKNGDILRENKFIQLDHQHNVAWLTAREGVKPPPTWLKGQPHPRMIPEAQRPPQPQPQGSSDEYDMGMDLDAILDGIANMDLSKLTGADTQKVQRLEAALKTRVERLHKRGQLIDRGLVATVFGRLYQIHSNEFVPLGAKLAPDIAGELGVEDPGAVLKIEQKIEDELRGILAHVKRLLGDFLGSVGAGAVE